MSNREYAPDLSYRLPCHVLHVTFYIYVKQVGFSTMAFAAKNEDIATRVL